MQGKIDEEQSRNLRGGKAIRVYREMLDSSPEIASSLLLIEHMLRKVDWRVESANDTPEAHEQATETEQALFEDMSHSFNDLISEITSMVWAGFSYFETVYKIRRGPDQKEAQYRSKFSDGKYGWRKIELRAQDTIQKWEFDTDGGIRGAYQRDHGSYSETFLPIEKCLLFRTRSSKGNPEGYSLLRPAILPYTFSKRLKEFEAIGIERNLAGMPVMFVPPEMLSPNASPAIKQSVAELEKWVTRVRLDENWGGLLPSTVKPGGEASGFDFKLMSTSGRQVNTDQIIRRYRDDILMIFRAQFMVLGMNGGGSFALSSNMTNLFSVALGALLDSIAEVINMFLIPRRQRLNGVSTDLDPYIVHGDLESRDLTELAAYMNQLTSSGIVQPNEKLERRMLEIADLPVPDVDETLADDGTEIDLLPPPSGLDNSKEFLESVITLNRAIAAGELTQDKARVLLMTSYGVAQELADSLL